MKREAFISFSFLRECILSPPFTFFIFLIFFFHSDNTLNQIFVPSFDKQTLLFFLKTTYHNLHLNHHVKTIKTSTHISYLSPPSSNYPSIFTLPAFLQPPPQTTFTRHFHSMITLYRNRSYASYHKSSVTIQQQNRDTSDLTDYILETSSHGIHSSSVNHRDAPDLQTSLLR